MPSLVVTYRYYQSEKLAGGVRLVGSGDYSTGMFSMEFSQPDYDWDDGAYQNNIEFTFKKSVFFADNLTICLGSGISSSGSNSHITQVSCLLQKKSISFISLLINEFIFKVSNTQNGSGQTKVSPVRWGHRLSFLDPKGDVA